MNDLSLAKKKNLIIANRDYLPMLFKYKNNHPTLNMKIMDRSDLIATLAISYDKDPLPYLIKEGIEYSKAKKYMSVLQTADINKNDKLHHLFNVLKDNDCLIKDELGLYEINQYEVYLFEDDEDEEIINLLKNNNISFKFLHIDDLDITPNGDYSLTFSNDNNDKCKKIKLFKNKFVQYLYIFSDIRRLIIDNPKRMNDIQILIKDESDIYYVRLFSSLFNIPVFASYTISVISLPGIRNKINEIYNNKSFIFNEEEMNNEELKPLIDIIKHYHLDELDDFSFAYANLLEIVTSMSVDERIDDKGIIIEKRYRFNDSSLIYVTNFQYDSFYKVYDDKNVLSDAELKEVGCNPSYINTKLDKRKKLNYLRYNHIVFLSRVEQHGTDAIFDSQFIDEFGLNKKGLIVKEDINTKGLYTNEALSIAVSDHYDRQFITQPINEYRSYDHSFNGVDEPIFNNDKKIWSVTNLERFMMCPFRYYISSLLPIRDIDDDYHNRALGDLMHKLFEMISKPDITFEEAFNLGKEEYIKKMNIQGFNKKEEAYLYAIKKWSEIIFKVAKEWYSVANIINNKQDSEQEIRFSLHDESGTTYRFKGRIDKIIWSKNDATNEKYYSIIDFKTGWEKFDPDIVFLGPSSQLPIYYYAIENNLRRDGYTGGGNFGGFYIQCIYSSTLKGLCDGSGAKSYMDLDSILKLLKMRGLALESPSYADSFDNTAFTKDHKKMSARNAKYAFVEGIKDLKGDDNVSSFDEKTFGDPIIYNFLDLVDDAKRGLIENINRILANDFPIAPALKDIKSDKEDVDSEQLVCSFCPYADICYKNRLDQHSFREEILNHFKDYIKDEDEIGGEA